jgi:hypothetical protein
MAINPEHIDRKLQKQIIFAFIFIFAVLQFVLNETTSQLQVVFRITMMVIGVAGFIYVSRRRA